MDRLQNSGLIFKIKGTGHIFMLDDSCAKNLNKKQLIFP